MGKMMCLLLLLTACSSPANESEIDQCMRREIFRECMSILPAGPQRTHYNDWDEVVDSCATTAYHQSLRLRSQVLPACRGGR